MIDCRECRLHVEGLSTIDRCVLFSVIDCRECRLHVEGSSTIVRCVWKNVHDYRYDTPRWLSMVVFCDWDDRQYTLKPREIRWMQQLAVCIVKGKVCFNSGAFMIRNWSEILGSHVLINPLRPKETPSNTWVRIFFRVNYAVYCLSIPKNRMQNIKSFI